MLSGRPPAKHTMHRLHEGPPPGEMVAATEKKKMTIKNMQRKQAQKTRVDQVNPLTGNGRPMPLLRMRCKQTEEKGELLPFKHAI